MSQSKKLSSPTPDFALRLYLAGRLPHSLDALANLKQLLAECGMSETALEVIDVLQEPERAQDDGIVVTPTLVRLWPKPVVRILGSLTDSPRVRTALELQDRSKGSHA